MTDLPEPLDDETPDQYALTVAYWSGVWAERARYAAAVVELDETWRRHGTRQLGEYRARLVTDMQRLASTRPDNTWRGEFPGGATIRRSPYAKPVRPFRYPHDPDAYEFVPDDGPDSVLTLATPVPWEPAVPLREMRRAA